MKRLWLFISFLNFSIWAQPVAGPPSGNLLASLPLSFEPAQTQTDSDSKYVSFGGDYKIELAANGVVIGSTGGQLRMRLEGGNPHAKVEPLEPLGGISNYFTGNDRSQWRTNIPHYGRVAVRDVYPGIDVVFYGNDRQLEYDVLVAPGANPSKIRWTFQPGVVLHQGENGDVVASSGLVAMNLRPPLIYQTANGSKRRINGEYAIQRKNNELAFSIGEYDEDKPLVIDPVIVYSTYLGGSSPNTQCFAVAVDPGGNVYVTGTTSAVSFPLSSPPPAFNSPLPLVDDGSRYVFVTKLSAQGNLVYSTFFGGPNGTGNGIAVDSAGNAYVTGDARSSLPLVNAFQATGTGFVLKLNPQGNALLYSSHLGPSAVGMGIAVDASQNAYVTGSTGANFPVVNDIQAGFGGGTDAFVAKVNPTGSALVYASYLGGNGADSGRAIAVDSNGNAYVTGVAGASFPVMNAMLSSLPSPNGSSVFVTEINAQGNGLVYSTYLGGPTNSTANGIAVDGGGNAYITGTAGVGFPVVNGVQQNEPSFNGPFVAKITAQGLQLAYSTFLGTNGDGNAIAVDSNGDAYVTGDTGQGFPLFEAIQPALVGGQNAFVTEVGPSGNTLVFSTYLGGGGDFGRGIAVNGNNIYVAGSTSAFFSGFPIVNAFQPTSTACCSSSGFVTVLSSDSTVVEPPDASTVSPNMGNGASQNFTFSFSGSPAGGGITSVQIDVNSALAAAGGCYFYYTAANNTLFLANDAGVFGPSLTVGFGGTLQNSQCTLNGSSVSLSGNTVTLSLNISFQPSFAGLKNVYMLAQGATLSSGWVQRGTWFVTSPSTPDFLLQITPTSQTVPSGATATYTVQVTGTNGFAGNVALSLSGLLSTGFTTTLNPSSVAAGGSATLTVRSDSGQSANFSVVGTSGPLTHSTGASLNINFPGSPVFLSVSPNGGSGTSQVFNFSVGNAGLNAFTLLMRFGISTADSGGCNLIYQSGSLTLLSDSGFSIGSLQPGSAAILANSQCVLDGKNSTVAAVGSTVIVQPALSFKNAFAGTKNIYAGFSTATLAQAGTFTVNAAATPVAPQAVSVMPNSGSGNSLVFSFTFSDTGGAANLLAARMGFGATQAIAGNCFFSYTPATNQIFLANDAGVFDMAATPGGFGGTLQNSQCAFDIADSSVSLFGNTLTLNLALSFKASFNGAKNIYMEAQNATVDSGFAQKGTFTVTSPATMPDFSVGITPGFQAVSVGANAIYLVTIAARNGFNSVVSLSALGLPPDATATFNPPSLPGSGTSTLTISASGPEAEFINFTVLASHGSLVHSASGGLSTTSSSPAPFPVSVTPVNGSGSSQLFMFNFSDNAGASDVVSVQVDIGAGLTAGGACYVFYSRPLNLLYLANDAGVFGPSIAPGTAGTMQNSQCTLDAQLTSVNLFGGVQLNLAVRFSAGFAGPKNVFGEIQNATIDSGWSRLGTFLVEDPTTTPDFSISVSPPTRTTSNGGQVLYTVTVTPLNGFVGVVSLGLLGVPSNAAGFFSPGGVISPGSSTLTILVFSTLAPGSYPITVTGTNGNVIHGAPLTLVVGSPTPQANSVSPSNGSGVTQAFSFQFSDQAGATDIASAQIDFGSSLVPAGNCYLYYARAANQIYLANDAGSFGPALTLGASGTMTNSQCTVDAGASFATPSGTLLFLNLALSFKPAFAGTKNIFMEVQNASTDSGWSQRGTFTVVAGGSQPPSLVSVNPSNGGGTTQTFQFHFSDAAGALNIVSTQMDINTALTPGGACYLYYVRASNQIYLANNAGVFGSPLTVGLAGSISNSQCTVNSGASSAFPSGNDFFLNVSLTFAPAFSGVKNIFMEAQNTSLDSGWAQRGTFNVGGVNPSQAPSAVSVSPSSGSGASQVFTFTYTDPLGVTDIVSAQMDINATLAPAGACYLFYRRSSNQIQLANDAGSFGTPMPVGTAGTISNSQCTIDTGASTALEQGNNLILNLSLSFKQPAFSGAKNVYMEIQNATLDSGWSKQGTWTVP